MHPVTVDQQIQAETNARPQDSPTDLSNEGVEDLYANMPAWQKTLIGLAMSSDILSDLQLVPESSFGQIPEEVRDEILNRFPERIPFLGPIFPVMPVVPTLQRRRPSVLVADENENSAESSLFTASDELKQIRQRVENYYNPNYPGLWERDYWLEKDWNPLNVLHHKLIPAEILERHGYVPVEKYGPYYNYRQPRSPPYYQHNPIKYPYSATFTGRVYSDQFDESDSDFNSAGTADAIPGDEKELSNSKHNDKDGDNPAWENWNKENDYREWKYWTRDDGKPDWKDNKPDRKPGNKYNAPNPHGGDYKPISKQWPSKPSKGDPDGDDVPADAGDSHWYPNHDEPDHDDYHQHPGKHEPHHPGHHYPAPGYPRHDDEDHFPVTDIPGPHELNPTKPGRNYPTNPGYPPTHEPWPSSHPGWNSHAMWWYPGVNDGYYGPPGYKPSLPVYPNPPKDGKYPPRPANKDSYGHREFHRWFDEDFDGIWGDDDYMKDGVVNSAQYLRPQQKRVFWLTLIEDLLFTLPMPIWLDVVLSVIAAKLTAIGTTAGPLITGVTGALAEGLMGGVNEILSEIAPSTAASRPQGPLSRIVDLLARPLANERVGIKS